MKGDGIVGTRVEWKRQEVLDSQTDAIAGLMREMNRVGLAPTTRKLVERAYKSQYIANVRTCRALWPLEREIVRPKAA